VSLTHPVFIVIMPPSQLHQQAPQTEQASGIMKYFTAIPREEYLKNATYELAKQNEARAEQQERQDLEDLARAQHKRARARERKRRQREHQKHRKMVHLIRRS
jgi:hypothetical protein